MPGFRVFMRPGGWRVTDGVLEHGPYPTYEQAHRSADNLNLQMRWVEHPSFAPSERALDDSVAVEVPADERPSVWEAREGGDWREVSHDPSSAEQPVERASVHTTDTPASGSASRGGGVA